MPAVVIMMLIWRLAPIISHYVYYYHTVQSLQIISVQINQTCLVTNNNTLDGSGQKSSDIFLCTQIIATLHLNSITTCDRDMFLENDIEKRCNFAGMQKAPVLFPPNLQALAQCVFATVSFYQAKLH